MNPPCTFHVSETPDARAFAKLKKYHRQIFDQALKGSYLSHGLAGGYHAHQMATSMLSKRSRGKRLAPERRFTAAEFFAGIGLVRLALERQGWRVVFANDIDPDKQEIYEQNFGADHFKLGDIHKLEPDEIPHCDLFTASFPCNRG